MYANSIINVTRLLKSAPETQKRRWPWELIQNACDSIYSTKNHTKKSVDVRIYVYDDRVEFHHMVVHSHSTISLDLFINIAMGKKIPAPLVNLAQVFAQHLFFQGQSLLKLP